MTSALSRRLLMEALGLGPSWVRRTVASAALPTDRRAPIGDEAADAAASPTVRAALIAALDWAPLRDTIAACRACPLSETRTRAVPGDGVSDAGWLVVGGGPSADDDEEGEAFAGPPGRLLDAMLGAVGRSRERDVFVTHVVKCRPPGDRPPTAAEVACCRPFLERQVALLAPRLVVAVGPGAAAGLLGDADRGADLRGDVHSVTLDARAIAVVVTDDPTTLIAAPGNKARVWADLCLARSLDAPAATDRPA